MWINKLTLHDYRAFQKECTIELGKNITVIAGMNGIGKSTILAVLTNVGELKGQKTINGSIFRGDFADIIMYDEKFDTTGDKAIVYFSDLPANLEKYKAAEQINFRASRHKASKKEVKYKKISNSNSYSRISKEINYTRYRLIPKRIDNSSTAKVIWPSLYLGLSRLAPIGEYDSANTKNIPKSISDEILKVHSEILSEDFELDTTTMLNVDVGIKHAKATINSQNYGYASNSNGQDNTGQIIESVLSFQILKDKLGDDYIGGILAIDELDASLHPAAQNKLFDWLLQKSLSLNLQIVFTTHSLTLLEHISDSRSKYGNVVVNYLRCFTPGIIKITKNPVKQFYRNDLKETYLKTLSESQHVSVYTEDEISRMFLNKIISMMQMEKDFSNMRFFDFNISWNSLIALANEDYRTFETHLFILDPDLNLENDDSSLKEYIGKRKIINFKVNNPMSNVFILPGNTSIEKMMWEYVNNLDGEHELFDDTYLSNAGINPRTIKSMSIRQDGDKNFYKHWFKDNSNYIEYFMKYWINDHSNEVKKFCHILKKSYDRIINSLGDNS